MVFYLHFICKIFQYHYLSSSHYNHNKQHGHLFFWFFLHLNIFQTYSTVIICNHHIHAALWSQIHQSKYFPRISIRLHFFLWAVTMIFGLDHCKNLLHYLRRYSRLHCSYHILQYYNFLIGKTFYCAYPFLLRSSKAASSDASSKSIGRNTASSLGLILFFK